MVRRVAVGVECLSGHRAGIARVGIDLFQALLTFDQKKKYFLVADRHIPWLNVEGYTNALHTRGSIFHPRLPDSLAIPFWMQFQLPRLLGELSVDLYLHTGTPPLLPFLPPWTKIRKVILLHDVINVKSPQFFNSITFFHGWLGKRQAVRSFDHILTVSDASRKDAQEYLGADYNKMTVFPPGVSKVFNNTPSQATFSQVRSRIGQGDAPFILFVGTLEPRKNLVGLLHAFRLSGLTDDYRLVVVGAKGWKTREILQAVENLGLTKSVYFVGFVPDEELCALYRLATLLCYPSFDEGFGLPVLEAMACGCPVITSGVPAIKQVGGEVPVYVDPRNHRSIAAALKRVVADEGARKSMLRRGQERARRYSWEQAALEVSKVIESVIGR